MSEQPFKAKSSDAEGEARRPAKKSPEAPRPVRGPKHYRLKFYLAVVVAAALAGLLIWQMVQSSSLRRESATERKALVREHTGILDRQAQELLRTSGSLLRLAISRELAAEDFDSIEHAIKPLVREESITVVAVADANGLIRLATNHKLEGKKLEAAFPGLPPAKSEVTIQEHGDGLIAIVPISVEAQEVGRAVMTYQHRRTTQPAQRP